MRIFIGSSGKALEYARKIERLLAELKQEPLLWEKCFPAGEYTLESLERTFKGEVDAGIFIIAPDDTAQIKEQEMQVARDNVWFELGLMAGQKDRVRTAACVVDYGQIRIPTDFLGINCIDISRKRKKESIVDDLKAWLERVNSAPMIAQPNVYITSRDEINPLFNKLKDNFSTEHAKKVKEIRMLNLAANAVFAPWLTDYDNNVRVIEKSQKFVLLKFFAAALASGASIDVITNAPTESVEKDAEGRIVLRYLGKAPKSSIFYATCFEIEKLRFGKHEICNAASNIFAQDKFSYRLTETILPYGLFEIRYKEGYEDNDSIKIDLYPPALHNEQKRRGMVIFKSTNPENYDFFSQNFDAVRLTCLSEEDIKQRTKEWRKKWDEILLLVEGRRDQYMRDAVSL